MQSMRYGILKMKSEYKMLPNLHSNKDSLYLSDHVHKKTTKKIYTFFQTSVVFLCSLM